MLDIHHLLYHGNTFTIKELPRQTKSTIFAKGDIYIYLKLVARFFLSTTHFLIVYFKMVHV
jgi:hypothetical protein